MSGDVKKVYPFLREVGFEDEVQEVKKEIVESRGLTIRTNNLVNSLASDIKSIAKRQASYERRLTWTSATAYILFAVLSFAGLKLASDARIQEIESEKRALQRQTKELREALSRETGRSEARARAQSEAKSFYDLVLEKKRAEAVKRYAALPLDRFSPVESMVFREATQEFRRELAMETLRSGLDLMRTGRFAEAAAKFRKALRYRDDKAHAPLFRFHLAEALHALGRHGEALLLAEQVIDEPEFRELQDDAMWLVSRCAEADGDLDRARDTMRALLRKNPRSVYATEARKRIRDLHRRLIRGSAPAASAAPAAG